VHVDGGWNSEPAIRNIETIVRKLNIDLHTHVIEWHEMKDLQLSVLKASVLNQDMPQDHAFFSTLYRTASQFKLKHFLSGVNFSSESIVPKGGFPAMDGKHLKALYARFGTGLIKSYPFMPLTEFIWMTRVRKVITIHRPLNYLNYSKEAAEKELQTLYGWRDYGGKHCESRFTKFYQELYLPRKFGFDKRRLHLSSLIVSGQISRDNALKELTKPIARPDQLRRDSKFIAKKLGITVDAIDTFMAMPAIDHLKYPNQMKLYSTLNMLKNLWRVFNQKSKR
jgi:hypothetical protein